MSSHLTPVYVAEALCGGPQGIGRIIGAHEKTPFAWRNGSSSRDAGDIPSVRIMRRLLAYSQARQLGLTAEHLIWGAPAAEIEAILAARPPHPPQLEAAE